MSAEARSHGATVTAAPPHVGVWCITSNINDSEILSEYRLLESVHTKIDFATVAVPPCTSF